MDEELEKFTRDFNLKSMLLSEEWFDKSLTYISGGALLLSISFIDKLVPFEDANCIWFLILSWLSLICSLVLNLLGHRKSSINAMTTINEIGHIDDQQFFDNAQIRNDQMHRITMGAIWSMGIGLLCLIIYCSINLLNMPTEKKDIQHPGDGTKSIPSVAFPPRIVQPAPSQPAQPPTPPPSSPKKP